MATKQERVQSIFDSVKGGAVDSALGLRVLNAFAYQDAYRQAWAQATGLNEVPTFAAMSNGQKLSLYLWVIRKYHKEIVQAAEANKAAEDARQAAIDKANSEVDLGND